MNIMYPDSLLNSIPQTNKQTKNNNYNRIKMCVVREIYGTGEDVL
jgi:hypothetical protein